LAEAQKRYDVYHISVLHSGQAIDADVDWKELLGQNCLSIHDHKEIPNVIKKIICDKHKSSGLGLGTTPLDGLDNIEML